MKQKIEELLHEAMKKGDKPKVILYRGLKADIQTAEKKGECNVIDVLVRAKKCREDAINDYLQSGRRDLADIELFEHSLICEFLPKAPDDNDLILEIENQIKNWGKNMGVIMKAVKAIHPTVDGKKLAYLVKQQIS